MTNTDVPFVHTCHVLTSWSGSINLRKSTLFIILIMIYFGYHFDNIYFNCHKNDLAPVGSVIDVHPDP
jgi:hypothetical protein